MEDVNCNLCGSAASRPVYSMPDAKFPADEQFTVVECSECGLGFVNPRPTRAEIGRYYPAEYYDYLAPAEHERRYRRQLEYLDATPRGAGPRRLLDVGCANGDFPRFAQRHGWEVEGVEISATTNPITDFRVHTVDFGAADIPAGSFDAVSAWAVLEHVHDPMSYFVAAARVLKDGGLFVFNVPNFASLSSKRLFREDIPRHIYFFTETASRRYLQAAGLAPVSVHYGRDVYEMRPTNWMRYLLLHRARGREMRWSDLPEPPARYFARRRLRGSIADKIGYVVRHPFTVLDRALMPAFEQATILCRRYGMFTLVARKGSHPR